MDSGLIVWCVPGAHPHHKFEDCVTEALWQMSLVSGQDDDTGSTDWDAWVALFSYFSPGHPPYHVDAGWIGIPTGAYLLFTNDQGYVWSKHYPTDGEARAEFDRIESAYDEWDGRE
jgi:hypothetical protein